MTDPGVVAPTHKNWESYLPRVENFYTNERFKDSNLVGKLYPARQNATLSHWALPGGEGSWENFTFDEIVAQTYEPAAIGDSFGPLWTTHWFKVEFEIPEAWTGMEVRFRWNSNSEAAIYTSEGVILQGFSTNQKRTDFILYRSYPGALGPQTYYIEMTVSKMFGGAKDDIIDPPDQDLTLTLEMAEIASVDTQIYKLILDMDILYGIASNMKTDQRGYIALHTANQMINDIVAGRFDEASALADQHFAKGNGERAHTLSAIGNCHIDTAWLWTYSETKRKAARSFSGQIKIMDEYPDSDFKFVASQAQQWQWVKESYPELYERIKPKVTAGKFLPVGTTWVEMDGNIPSGESFIRQFYYGNKFYNEEFGYTCKEFWLPDTFGYSAQIPALMKHVGLSRFLTQKMSWNLVNTFPHQNFIWEGIDGSTVLVHFPPGDKYDLEMKVEEALFSESNLLDKGRVSTSAFLFGWGDGGGGPTQNMLEKATRMKDIDGLPKMNLTTPNGLFDQLESETENMMKWVGELYLELHNGTYTTQADSKRLCRSTEFKFRDAEFMLSAAALTGSGTGTLLLEQLNELEPAWKKVLLNQFHDVLPGTSIARVYTQVNEYYEEAATTADAVLKTATDAVFGTPTTTTSVALNTLQWPRKEVVEIDTATARKYKLKTTRTNSQSGRALEYFVVDAPAFGYGQLTNGTYENAVTITEADGVFTLDNGLVFAQVSSEGQLISLSVPGETRDLLQATSGEAKFGNKITLFDDEPIYWDAWDIMDYHLETATVLNGPGATSVTSPVSIVESGPIVGRLSWSMSVGENSTMTQEIIMYADTPYIVFDSTVDWQENHKLLKTEFDTNLLVRNASYDIQFGFIERATHMNTTWDTARFEVCGHKWADISEPNVGMSVLNDCKFGWMGRGSSLTLTLLKAPKAPDDTADMKTHTFKYAVMPHAGTLQEAEVMRHGYEFNNPLRVVEIDSAQATASPTWSAMSVEGSGVVLHTIKAADDASGDVILRVFESDGCRSSGTIRVPAVVTANECTGFEVVGDAIAVTSDATSTTIPVSLTPFQIKAIRLKKTPAQIIRNHMK